VPIALLVVAVAPFVLVTSGLLALVYGATRLGEAGIADMPASRPSPSSRRWSSC
jgi:hypothetical protein